MNPDPDTPDPPGNFRLQPHERRRIQVAFDADAVEQLLAMYHNRRDRDRALESFLNLADGVARGVVDVTGMSTESLEIGIQDLVRRIADRLQDRHHDP